MAQFSGAITVTVPGTAVQGPDTPRSSGGGFMLRAIATNTDTVYFGDDGTGDVDAATGMYIEPTDLPFYVQVEKLSDLWFDAVVAGEGVVWFVIPG